MGSWTATPPRRGWTIAPKPCRARPMSAPTGTRARCGRCSGGAMDHGRPRCRHRATGTMRRVQLGDAPVILARAADGGAGGLSQCPAATAVRNCAGAEVEPLGACSPAPITPGPMTPATGGWSLPPMPGPRRISTARTDHGLQPLRPAGLERLPVPERRCSRPGRANCWPPMCRCPRCGQLADGRALSQAIAG
jgi:hypothetical protein